jgi:hypothetical protein
MKARFSQTPTVAAIIERVSSHPPSYLVFIPLIPPPPLPSPLSKIVPLLLHSRPSLAGLTLKNVERNQRGASTPFISATSTMNANRVVHKLGAGGFSIVWLS